MRACGVGRVHERRTRGEWLGRAGCVQFMLNFDLYLGVKFGYLKPRSSMARWKISHRLNPRGGRPIPKGVAFTVHLDVWPAFRRGASSELLLDHPTLGNWANAGRHNGTVAH
jgi:hypothetical protein